jgi:preprotein translocase subunit SecG
VWRRSWSEPLEVREPDLDERAHRLLEAGLPRERERFLVRGANLFHGDALLQPIVPGHEELLDACPGVDRLAQLACSARFAHRENLLPLLSSRVVLLALSIPWLQISAVIQVVLSAVLVTLVLMHSGRDAGFGGMGFTPASQGGTHIVEKNLTRLTVMVAAIFGLNTILLFHLL